MKRHESASSVRDPRVDDYIDRAEPFARPILSHLRELVHSAYPAKEAIKWGKPVFLQDEIILAHLAAFKRHCVLAFWGSEMQQACAADGFASSAAIGVLGPFHALSDLPPDSTVRRYVRLASGFVINGQRTKSLDRAARKSATRRSQTKP